MGEVRPVDVPSGAVTDVPAEEAAQEAPPVEAAEKTAEAAAVAGSGAMTVATIAVDRVAVRVLSAEVPIARTRRTAVGRAWCRSKGAGPSQRSHRMSRAPSWTAVCDSSCAR